MRIDELYDVKQQSRTLDREKLDNPLNGSKGFLGAGHFSRVNTDADPHLVKKQNSAPYHNIEREDMYWAYVSYIVDNSLAQSNPYFPRIYGVTSVKDKGGREIRRAKMEKLEPFKNISDEELKMLWDKISTIPPDNGQYTFGGFCDALEEKLKYGTASPKNDESFQEYVKLFAHFWETKKGRYNVIDIKPANLMIRRTRYGVQLVITDPVA